MIDLHCDALSRVTEKQESLLSNSGQWDVWRARAAGVSLQVLALFTSPEDPETDWKVISRQAAYLQQQFEQELIFQKTQMISSPADVEEAEAQEKLGLLLHLEGVGCLGKNLDRLETLYEWGVRSLALTWNERNHWADGVSQIHQDGGLTSHGKDLIRLMNEKQILLDLAHASPKTFFQALDVTRIPAYVSHANTERLCRHPRNLTDDQIRAVAGAGGIIGLTYYQAFLSQKKARVLTLLEHMSHIADLVGCQAIALGSDFDGAEEMIFADVVAVMELKEAMLKYGFYESEAEQIISGNARKYLQENL